MTVPLGIMSLLSRDGTWADLLDSLANVSNRLFSLQTNLIYRIKSADGRCGHCGPEECRAQENLLVTTKAEEKKIVKVHIPFKAPRFIMLSGAQP